jgi:hypothetical protein
MGPRLQRVSLPKFPCKTARKERRNWRIEEAKAAVCGNKANGIVERNQWNRSTKSMESFNEINGFVPENWHFC